MATPKANEQLQELEELARVIGVKISYEPMAGPVTGGGGLCRVRGEYRIIIDKRLKAPERVQLLSEALGRFSIADEHLSPKIAPLFGRVVSPPPTPTPDAPAADPHP